MLFSIDQFFFMGAKILSPTGIRTTDLWCSEYNNITNFSKILLKLAIVFKIFEYFCPFLSLTILSDQRSFLSLRLHDKYP